MEQHNNTVESNMQPDGNTPDGNTIEPYTGTHFRVAEKPTFV